MKGFSMLNFFTIQGRLTFDPEIKTSSKGTPFIVLKLSCLRNDKSKGNDFIDVFVFGSRTEIIKKYFNKGSEIIVSGTIGSNKNAESGKNTLILTADNFYFVGNKSNQSKEDDCHEPEYGQLPF